MSWTARLRLAMEWAARIVIFLVAVLFFLSFFGRSRIDDMPLAVMFLGFMVFLGMRSIAQAMKSGSEQE